LFPEDKRLRVTVGDKFLFTYNEPERAIAEYKKAIEIDPLYHPAYNGLGYAYSALGNYGDAERTFKKYTELLPDESNPHDSYAEVLMKQGHFDHAIAEYKRSLSINPQFITSYLGLGMSYVLMGNADEGRRQYRVLYDMAEDDNDRIQSLTASSRSYLIEGMYDRAIGERRKLYALLQKADDFVRMAYNIMGTAEVFAEAGKPKEAQNELQQALQITHDSKFPAEARVVALQFVMYEEAVVALAFDDFTTAKSKSAEFATLAGTFGNPVQIQISHQLAGQIALKEKRYDDALRELQQADQRSALTLYHIARVHAAKGESEKARECFGRAANFNDMSYEYAIVRLKAKTEFEKVKL
jgi:tetratricopeptide (TPR) repeat protein